MKDIKAILSAFELSDDDREAIIKEVGENYRSIVEVENKAKRITELESEKNTLAEQNAALTEQVGNLEGDSEEVAKLREQVATFEANEAQRKADAEEKGKREAFRSIFEAAIGDREFANDIVRDSIFDKAYARCTETTGLDAKQVIEDLTKDSDGIWKNPQNDVNTMPVNVNGSEGGEIPVRNLSDVKGMSQDDINRNWDTIGKLLANKKG